MRTRAASRPLDTGRVCDTAGPPPDRQPSAYEPMLAATAAAPFDSRDHIFEVLWDGVRALAHAGPEGVRIVDRYGRDVSERYPELQGIGEQVREEAVLDGVIVAMDQEGRPDIARLLPRLSAVGAGAADLWCRFPVTYQAFDVLALGGRPVTGFPLRARKERLAEAVRRRGPACVPDFIAKDGIAFFEAARQHELEGIVAKEWESEYLRGQRTPAWQKIKVYQKREFVIAGFTYGGKWRARRRPREPFASLLLGVYDGTGGLRYAGEVSGGFGDSSQALVEALDALTSTECPFAAAPEVGRLVFWCRPELCATVRFGGQTPEGQLRFPVFEALRPDVPAYACRAGD